MVRSIPKPTPAPEHPWDPQPTDGTRGYAYFQHYRDAGAERSLVKTGQALGVSTTLLEDLSRKHGWQKRVRAYDAHLDRVAQQAAQKEIERLAKNNVRIAIALQSKLVDRLKSLKAGDIAAKNLPSFLKALAAVEQSSRGARVFLSGPEGGPIETLNVGSKERLADLLGAAAVTAGIPEPKE